MEKNRNDYYIIQLLKDNSSNHYSVWMRFGRVGTKGLGILVNCRSLESAKRIFTQKFSEKTNNIWENRYFFTKEDGYYDLLELDHGAGKDERTPNKRSDGLAATIWNQSLRKLIVLVCDIETMGRVVTETSHYDASQAPLGKLTQEQVTAGYLALNYIDGLLKMDAAQSDLVKACNDYYAIIPHDFGINRPPIINMFTVEKELELLETLGDIAFAIRMRSGIDSKLREDSVYHHYLSLNCDLIPLDVNDKEFKMVEEYLLNSSICQGYEIELEAAFVCHKESEHQNFKDFGNRMLLFHGSLLTNWVGILRHGLRIAPPEARRFEGKFGKGIYFADRSYVSAHYCLPTTTDQTVLMLLCEVSLGVSEELTDARNMTGKLPKNKHSVKGLGKVIPEPSETRTENGVSIPLGTNVYAPNHEKLSLNFNEYIVYDPRQVKMSYLLKFNFKS